MLCHLMQLPSGISGLPFQVLLFVCFVFLYLLMDGSLLASDKVSISEAADTPASRSANSSADGEKRSSARILYDFRWPNATVPYMLDSSYSEGERNLILSAMRELELLVCVHFQPRTDEVDYTSIVRKDNMCYSDIGRLTGHQEASLGVGCLTRGILLHELSHMLGLWHEHTRRDRDKYVSVIWDNILEDRYINFETYSHDLIEATERYCGYDYGSIMHYPPVEFAKDPGRPTLLPKEPGIKLNKIGQREGLTGLDICKLSLYYNCGQRRSRWDHRETAAVFPVLEGKCMASHISPYRLFLNYATPPFPTCLLK